MNLRSFAVSLFLLFLMISAVAAQTKPLTNDDISKMIAAGLPESTIVQVIHKGPAAFDTSPEALIKLKRAGATSKIMEAMLGLNTNGAGPTAPSERPAASSNKGVYLQTADGRKRIEEVSSIEVRAVGGIASRNDVGPEGIAGHLRLSGRPCRTADV